MLINTLLINPPLLNSSSLWASSYDQLEELYDSPYTGAVTTRTSTLTGFQENAQVHKHVFLGQDSSINSYGYSPHPLETYLDWILAILERQPSLSTSQPSRSQAASEEPTASSNHVHTAKRKPFIISIAPSSVTELTQMLDMIQNLRQRLNDNGSDNDSSSSSPTPIPNNSLRSCRIGIELNTSCPNIEGRYPPAYNPNTLFPFLKVLKRYYERDGSLTIGLKLAPFVHFGQFEEWIKVLIDLSPQSMSDERSGHESRSDRIVTEPQSQPQPQPQPQPRTAQEFEPEPRHCISFLSCTNTLGSNFIFPEQENKSESESESRYHDTNNLSMTGPALATEEEGLFGGQGGSPIHTLALGNVRTFKKLLMAEHQHPESSSESALRRIHIIGIGGVTSKEARERMEKAGASAVACATVLGIYGAGVFRDLL